MKRVIELGMKETIYLIVEMLASVIHEVCFGFETGHFHVTHINVNIINRGKICKVRIGVS